MKLIYFLIFPLIILMAKFAKGQEEEVVRFIDAFFEHKKEILNEIQKLKENLGAKENLIVPENADLHKKKYKNDEKYKKAYDKLEEGFGEFQAECLNPLEGLIGGNGPKLLMEVEKFTQEIEEYILGQIFGKKQQKLRIHFKLYKLTVNAQELVGKWRKCRKGGKGRTKMQEALFSLELGFVNKNERILNPIARKFGAAIALGQSIQKFLEFIAATNLGEFLIGAEVKRKREEIDLGKMVEMFENYHAMIKAALASLKGNKGLIFFKIVNADPEEKVQTKGGKSAENLVQNKGIEEIIRNNQKTAKLIDELLAHELLKKMEEDEELMTQLIGMQRKRVDLLQFIFFNRLPEPMKALIRDEFAEPGIRDVVISLLECKFARLLLQKIIFFKVPNLDPALAYLRQNLANMKESPNSNIMDVVNYLNEFEDLEIKIGDLAREMQSRENEIIREFFGSEEKDPYKIWRFMFREGVKNVPNFPQTEREIDGYIEEVKKNKKELDEILEGEIDLAELK